MNFIEQHGHWGENLTDWEQRAEYSVMNDGGDPVGWVVASKRSAVSM